MKTLNDYKQNAQTELFKTTGAIFAFSKNQFDAAKVQNVKYTNLGGGMVCPTENVKQLIDGLDAIEKKAIADHLNDYKLEDIILDELFNHEYCYTCDIGPVLDALGSYPGISVELVRQVVRKNYNALMEDA